MKKSVKSIVVLLCICVTVAVLMAVTNYITAPIIAGNEQGKSNEALLEVLPEGGNFELVDISAYTLPESVAEVYKASNGGYVIKINTTGYAPGMVLMCGISADGAVVGTKLVSSGETPSIGGVAAEQFAPAVIGRTLEDIDGVDTVSGATKTTEAYRAAVRDALNAVVILGGGEVDLRTPEEIFNENLSAALPAANGEFEAVFICEVIEGVDAIYAAKNGSGYVSIIGEQFIGADADGKVTTECSDADRTAIESALAAIKATELVDIDLSLYEGLSARIISAKRTLSGNYVIEVEGEGYSKFLEQFSGVGYYINIRVSITPDGKIIDTLTLEHHESKGIGDACANEEFYSQFDGKTEANYADIDAISGATKTTDGYKGAILNAFKAVKIFEGGDK
jgi:electron transport complex protein RnfG